MEYTYRDCYMRYDAPDFVIGNDGIERVYRFFGDALTSVAVINKKSGKRWENSALPPILECVTEPMQALSCRPCVEDGAGLSAPSLCVRLVQRRAEAARELIFRVYPGLPFVQTGRVITGAWEDGGAGYEGVDSDGIETRAQETQACIPAGEDVIDTIRLPQTHLRIESVMLYDKTDGHDTLVTQGGQPLYARGEYSAQGNLFLLEDMTCGEGLFIGKEAPTHLSALGAGGADIRVYGNRYLELHGSGLMGQAADGVPLAGYGSVVGVGAADSLPQLYKEFYNAQYLGDRAQRTFVMSNTWGDRNQDGAVCEAFMLREIEAAARLGVDIVQIDDGWQKGITANSRLAKGGVWEGYYAADEDFWQVNARKFPRGLEVIVQAAKEKGVALGLWFSPDSSRDFANWQRDVQVLLALHERYGIGYFKLDGVKIRTKLAEAHYLSLLDAVTRNSRGAISFNQDITAEDRLGYVYEKQYGTLFVENRYTDWGNYYPHNTLKNVWSLSRYFPMHKFQFEVLNNTRNRAVYGDDPFAPHLYDIDYAFASVMVCNPLLWMELSALPEAACARLARIIAVYKQHRAAMWRADVRPLAQMPDGRSFTGLEVACRNGAGYLILFRENTQERAYEYVLSQGVDAPLALSCLCSNLSAGEYDFPARILPGQSVRVSFGRARSYLFLQYTRG